MDAGSNDPTPEHFGFLVRPTERGDFCLVVTGENPWYLGGFKSLGAAHLWVLEYLTTLNTNHAKLALEQLERKRLTDEQIKLSQAEWLAKVDVVGDSAGSGSGSKGKGKQIKKKVH